MKTQKITTTNYFDTINKIGFESLPLVLKQSHTVILTKTVNGEDWSKYTSDADLKRMIDLVFKKLEEFMQSRQKSVNGIKEDEDLDGNYLTPKDVAINLIKPSVLRADTIDLHPTNKLAVNEVDYAAHIQNKSIVVTMLYGTKINESFSVDELMNEIIMADTRNKFPSKHNTEKASPRKKRAVYNHKQPEFRVLKAILNWHNATVYKRMVENFINELQGYIKSKKITKKSIVAKEINLVQEKLIHLFNNMEDKTRVVLSPETRKIFQNALKKVTDITKFDDANNKKGLGEISDSTTEVKAPKQNIMSSMDFANLEFSTLGLKDKWLDFIGDPAPGFTAMVYGRPKMGKSYLCVDFAGYLARNHGNVLYVAKEEKLDATLQKKLKDKAVAHPNLFVADNLPKDLKEYQFVILDSVNKLGLNPKDLEKLKADNKGVSFIYIFQTTKEGKFRGTNEFQHDVDVIIEVPEKGVAIQNGRFNQGGEMRIFDDGISGEDNLSGIGKVKKKSVHEPIIEIETEFGIPLEELAIELISPKQKQEAIIDLLDNHSKKVEASVLKMVKDYIKEANVNVLVTKVEFTQMDSDNLNHGAAYFAVHLIGTKTELKKIAGNDMLFVYDWENPSVEGLSKKLKHNLTLPTNVSMLDGNNKNDMKNKVKKVDWTEPEGLNQADWQNLKTIKKYFDKGDYESAMNHAMNCDTVVREEIPPEVWKAMGGKLTKTGEEKLAKNLNNSKFNNRADDLNPKYMFSTTATQLLSEALKGDFDITYLLKKELANRGLDINGKWIGFDKAKEIHKV